MPRRMFHVLFPVSTSIVYLLATALYHLEHVDITVRGGMLAGAFANVDPPESCPASTSAAFALVSGALRPVATASRPLHPSLVAESIRVCMGNGCEQEINAVLGWCPERQMHCSQSIPTSPPQHCARIGVCRGCSLCHTDNPRDWSPACRICVAVEVVRFPTAFPLVSVQRHQRPENTQSPKSDNVDRLQSGCAVPHPLAC